MINQARLVAEQNLIASLLAEPNGANLISLNPEEFEDLNLRATYQAIADDPNDSIEFFGKAKGFGFNGEFVDFDRLGDYPLKNADVRQLAKSVRMQADYDKIRLAYAEWQANPIDDKIQVLKEAIHDSERAKDDESDGDIKPPLDDIYNSTLEQRPTGIKSYKGIDLYLNGGFKPGMLFSIGARPAVGKSSFMMNLAVQVLNHNEDVRIDIFTLEMPAREVLMRFVANYTKIPLGRLYQPYNNHFPITETERAKIKQANDVLASQNLYVYDKHFTLDSILSQISLNAEKAQPGKYIAVIDYIGLVGVDGYQNQRHLQIQKITGSLKQLALRYDIPIIALTQLNRMVDNRDSKEPGLSDIRESGSLEQDSNVVGFLWNDEEPSGDQHLINFSVKKNRDGRTGRLKFVFVPAKMTIVPYES